MITSIVAHSLWMEIKTTVYNLSMLLSELMCVFSQKDFFVNPNASSVYTYMHSQLARVPLMQAQKDLSQTQPLAPVTCLPPLLLSNMERLIWRVTHSLVLVVPGSRGESVTHVVFHLGWASTMAISGGLFPRSWEDERASPCCHVPWESISCSVLCLVGVTKGQQRTDSVNANVITEKTSSGLQYRSNVNCIKSACQ